MNYAEQLRAPAGGHSTGLAVVVTLHLLLGWALLNGLGTRVIEIIKPPVDIEVVKDVQMPPPPPAPALPQPKSTARPVYLAPVPEEVRVSATPEPTITANREGSSDAQPWADSATNTTPVAPPQPRAVAKPAIANVLACAPGSDDYPAAARRAEATGLTRLRFTIDAAGALVRSEIVKSAGLTREHRLLDKVAESKLASCHFTAGVDENGRAIGGTFEVDYVWKLE
ncbi:energy transducer TonB [Ideonella sp.]|uniref:energy transducer TonB n=1 Tax=Ideonella sp. TaxID=1929293 RepID=UPI0035B29FE9